MTPKRDSLGRPYYTEDIHPRKKNGRVFREKRSHEMAKIETTQYGFTYGPATVERAFSDDKAGWVTIILKTAKHPDGFQLYVTKTGPFFFLWWMASV